MIIMTYLVCFLFLSVILFYRLRQKQVERIAFTDALTGGMNDTAFRAAYEKLAARMEPSTYAVVFLNIKGFKFINEYFGSAAGNDTLKYIYSKLIRHICTGEIAARDNSDCFFLCLKEHSKEAIRYRLQKMTADINSFNASSDIEYQFTILQGIYLVDDPKLDVTIVLDRARTACRQRHGTDPCSFFHPDKGMICPSDFIPLFEENGKICRLDLYVYETVCAYLHKRIEQQKDLFPISVNLSRAHFKDLNFLRKFSELKAKYGIPDGMIEFELTEYSFLDKQQREMVKNCIKQMHRLGFHCALDDFGVGYSALALLKDFDVDTIKLDRQFFVDMTNPKAQTIISGFIEISEKLGIHLVAEGIETKEQMELLKQFHCEMVQGYYFSKPLTIDEFEKWKDTMQKQKVFK